MRVSILLFLFLATINSALALNQFSSSFPFWSKLTPFENKTLLGLAAAERGSDEALLRLFVFASGDLRTHSDYRKIKLKINNFFDSYGAEITRKTKIWDKGNLLNRSMHQYFFNSNGTDNNDGYDADQSQLTEIFRTGKYNCVSSTALYLYLAKRINLNVQAVVLPSHTFVELRLNNGNKVDVETTSANGFDWTHDREFYKQVAKNWFSERGLSPSTYKDYQNREIIKPWRLAVLNMRHQHTRPERMAKQDNLRLLEVTSYLDNKDEEKWLSVLYAYNRIFNEFRESQQFHQLVQLYDATYSRVVDFHNTKFISDQNLNELLHWYYSQAAFVYFESGDIEMSRQIMLAHYDSTKKLSTTKPEIFSNNQMVFFKWLKKYFSEHKFSQADSLISLTQQLGADNERWQKAVVWYFSSRLKALGDNSDWKGIISLWKNIRQTGINDSNIKGFESNIEIAYQNYALEFQRKQNWRAAAEVLLQCTEKVQLALECTKTLDDLAIKNKLF